MCRCPHIQCKDISSAAELVNNASPPTNKHPMPIYTARRFPNSILLQAFQTYYVLVAVVHNPFRADNEIQ